MVFQNIGAREISNALTLRPTPCQPCCLMRGLFTHSNSALSRGRLAPTFFQPLKCMSGAVGHACVELGEANSSQHHYVQWHVADALQRSLISPPAVDCPQFKSTLCVCLVLRGIEEQSDGLKGLPVSCQPFPPMQGSTLASDELRIYLNASTNVNKSVMHVHDMY